jgi:hypothetical protein
MTCEAVKPITDFSYGFGSYRKSDKCDKCKGEKLKKWVYGGSIRAIGETNRVCRSSTYFDKKPPCLSKLKGQVRMISGRDYKVTENEK